MAGLSVARDVFLWSMSAIYLFAFGSLYVQIPGLYGDNGILPARLVVPKEAGRLSELLDGQPTLLRVTPWLGLSTQKGMDFLCLLGIIVAFVSLLFKAQRNSITFALLWALYLSLFQVGQTFLWFQWDILLLEIGFLTVFVAPINLYLRRLSWYPHDGITFWLIKWLLFRLMFSSGVVKLTSQCPTWWGLTALDWHFESQCIPTPLSWYFHHLPHWLHRLGIVAVYVTMIPIPFLAFSPIRSMRLFCFYAQIFCQVLILLTGNYNFFNLLTMVICVSLLDNDFFKRRSRSNDPGWMGKIGRPLRWIINLLVYSGILYYTVNLFSLKINFSPFRIDSKIVFTPADLDNFLKVSVPASIWLGVVCLAWEILKAMYSSLFRVKGCMSKLCSLCGTIVFGIAACGLFTISLVNYTRIEKETQQKILKEVGDIYKLARPYKLSSSFGLFKRMTGVGGRPELIIEGSDLPSSGWKEYNFLYKPGNLSGAPPFVAPHQPRLDWQMWFAALGSFQHNPWFVNLVYRLLTGQPEVLELMSDNPFAEKPPKYIKATLYKYHFTSSEPKNKWYSSTDWWVREKPQEYMGVFTKDNKDFVKYLQDQGVHKIHEKDSSTPGVLVTAIDACRQYVGHTEGFLFVMALFVTALVLQLIVPKSKSKPRSNANR